MKTKYTQNWPSYNTAKMNEKLLLLRLLKEVTECIDIPKQTGRGRRFKNIRDMVFCACLMLYNGKSSRRSYSEFKIAKRLGYIEDVPHYNTVLDYLNRPEMTQIFHYLITLTSLPLVEVERYFTIDASGFGTQQYERWFKFKWGKFEGKERVWKKAHVASGVKTNIITRIEITDKKVADIRMFEKLVRETGKNFNMLEVSADKAYLSRKNLELAMEYGALAYIPFKSNSSGKSGGSYLWLRMYRYFKDNQEEFLEHYHRRSNAETIFSMMKTNFTNRVRCKNETAQVNELLCVAVCHNICVLIQEMFELRIEVDFNSCLNKLPAR